MTYWKKVQETNPIIFELIKNSINNNQLAHALLLSCTNNQEIDIEWKFIVEALLAKQSFVDHDTSIETYSDLIVIDGSKELIKKELVADGIRRLSETALEDTGKKIMVIKNIDNSNKHSLNALLKFLEEPTENTFIIMTTNRIFNVLNTIKSRAQLINIRPKTPSQVVTELTEEGMPYPQIFGQIVNGKEQAKAIKNPTKLVEGVVELFEKSNDHHTYITASINNYFNKDNAVIMGKLINIFLNDIWRFGQNEQCHFKNIDLLKTYQGYNYKNALVAVDEFLFALSRNAIMSVALSALALKLEEAYE